MSAAAWIERLGLEPHPEGGWFAETYRSPGEIGEASLGEGFDGPRPYSTAIYFLLDGAGFSALHRLRADEVWHHYDGAGVTLHLLEDDGTLRVLALDRRGAGEARPQVTVPAGVWFGAAVDDPESYALVGCTMSPGFDFRDFELGRREDLVRRFPEHRDVIERLTR
jgi:predicted cupin superfamily sugar epimerase